VRPKAIIPFVILALSILLNIWSGFQVFQGDPSGGTERQYPYLSTRIWQEYARDILILFTPLRLQLRDLVQNEYNNEVALYFEYLPTGTSIGINDRTEFYIASLLKVPVVISYFHHQEQLGDVNDPEVTLEDRHIDKTFGTLWQRGVGAKVSLRDAVEAALTQSDNTAFNLLNEYVDQEDLDYVFEGLDLQVKFQTQDRQTIMTVKGYSSIFKSLYYGAIISKEHSERVLELLAQSRFRDGIPAGLPQGTPIAHKVGIYNTSNLRVYSDCGIVYVTRRPYLLCVASKSDEAASNERIKSISQAVYEFISKAQ
jgi:beta-lactamase class A